MYCQLRGSTAHQLTQLKRVVRSWLPASENLHITGREHSQQTA
jgi:hypothetical protein